MEDKFIFLILVDEGRIKFAARKVPMQNDFSNGTNTYKYLDGRGRGGELAISSNKAWLISWVLFAGLGSHASTICKPQRNQREKNQSIKRVLIWGAVAATTRLSSPGYYTCRIIVIIYLYDPFDPIFKVNLNKDFAFTYQDL